MRIAAYMQSYFRKHPFLFAIFALIASRIVGLGTTALIQTLRPDLSIEQELGWLLMLIYASVVATLVYWTNTAEETGLRRTVSAREWLLMLPFLALLLFIGFENGVQSWGFSRNLVLAIAAVGVAVNEEVLFRGILLRGFMRWGPWTAIFVPSALFALAHSTNALAGGNAKLAIYQTVWTFAAGVALSAMRLRCNSLYPIIAFHVLLDGTEYFSTGEYGVHAEAPSLLWLQLFMLANAALALYAVFLFYSKARQRSTRPGRPADRSLPNGNIDA
ncbi:CPBP family intramembrane glutamic endopeptidase [Cohnella lubricantis]|uniref:CPBP family intramembrane metalloprotease n=1 Tax=Cohnella lubricantis TaxID=2163172 RepID=A0A841TJ79_9BACL|nr:CPBP family intramembrane glutamic endopeptidase [Cohnella lubricantis]MBB6678561.1 CPBP family intramembrane metalloprotease [Cohnella lubricantis]MBP2119130.1 membrane protease YdiL (CAAX protease family) [Cohnella lubricantis]